MKLVHSSQFTVHRFFLLLTLLLTINCFNASAAPVVSLGELMAQQQEYDGKPVNYEGEVVGDIMLRGENAWVNVHDADGAIGIFCPRELTGEIEYKGSYDFIGDVILARGIFNYSCDLHGGDTDIHAESLSVVRKGESISHPLEERKVTAGIILSAITILFLIGYLVTRRRR
jgi:hypothetical protein